LGLEHHLTGRWLTDLANFSAFVFHELPDLNWAGFYLDDGSKLVLGPFVGRPACTEIAYSRGVCGAAFTSGETVLVPDVHEFPGHIACDSASRSEMVVPMSSLGVFDLDSPSLNRFSEKDRLLLEGWMQILLNSCPTLKNSPWKSTT
jgi:L-methionine (R)-S-oxide reductase